MASVNQTPTRRPQRTASVLSHASEANTVVETTANGNSLIRSAATSATATQRHARTVMILIKSFAQDRAEIELQIESSSSSPSGSNVQLHTDEHSGPPSSSPSSRNSTDTTATAVSPNQYLIDWTLKAFNIDPINDMLILVNVRPNVTSAKTKVYDSSIAAFATMYDAEEREKSIRLLQRYLSGLWRRGYQCRALSLHGDKREEIAARANEENVHSIVVGMRRRQKTSLIVGKRGFVSNLVQMSEVPVTTVRLPQ
ncbi:hypothetical protein GGH94_003140 [Coemansia aciculifera]|uniref:UspA domain-containing protein n=1 Tax=Coemansia aciculifera TaxID=417176 RepID=A0A9W8IHP3_9FUNG|nr:hypothetical protein GGH94_003140 [Coemansia aciculifera]KAJ2875594.1 hypothetical protein GGH93_001468 [Coemansia aciculifera]